MDLPWDGQTEGSFEAEVNWKGSVCAVLILQTPSFTALAAEVGADVVSSLPLPQGIQFFF